METIMTEKELREIKRRFRPEKNNIPKIVGCFVNSNKEIIARISQFIGTSDSVVSEKLLGVMKKTLSGTLVQASLRIMMHSNLSIKVLLKALNSIVTTLFF